MNALEAFLKEYPAYAQTSRIDALRESDYAILDQQGHIYLDYTGGGLYGASQLKAHQELLRTHVFGNPHSYNPTSAFSTEMVERARKFVLEFFNAPEDEYVCIFTQNASGALKIVGEAYPFGEGCRYLLAFDNHNSVNGIREYAHARGASVTYIPVVLPDLRIDVGTARPGLLQPVCLPGPIQLFRRAASAGMDRAGPGPGLGCAAGRGRFRAHQPAGPIALETGLRAAFLL
jgi:selenocysteine lyase/cysteine desulfurase